MQQWSYQVLQTVHQLIKSDERALRLHVGVLGKMTTRGRLLSAVRLRNTEHITEGWDGSLKIQLRALCQVGILLEILDLEEGRASLNLSPVGL